MSDLCFKIDILLTVLPECIILMYKTYNQLAQYLSLTLTLLTYSTSKPAALSPLEDETIIIKCSSSTHLSNFAIVATAHSMYTQMSSSTEVAKQILQTKHLSRAVNKEISFEIHEWLKYAGK